MLDAIVRGEHVVFAEDILECDAYRTSPKFRELAAKAIVVRKRRRVCMIGIDVPPFRLTFTPSARV